MIERLPRFWRNVSLLALAAAVLWFCWSIRSVMNPLILGYLCAYILHPAVEKFEARGMSRRTSVLVIFGLGFAAATAMTVGLFVQTKNLVRYVVTDEDVRTEIQVKVEGIRQQAEEFFGEDVIPSAEDLPDPVAAIEWFRSFVQEHREAAQKAGVVTVEAAGGIFDVVGSLIGAIVAIGGLFVLVPLYTYFLLFELGRVNDFFKTYIPKSERERIPRVAGQIGEVLSSFFRGRLLVCLLKGTVIAVGLLIAGVPYWFLFGMLGGFLSIIPFVGPTVGFVGAFLVGLVDYGVVSSLLRTGIVFGLAELLEGYVFIPKIMGDSLGLHEVVVLFALLAGGAALGMFGVLISLPLAATIVILFREFVVPALTEWAEEERGGGGGGGPPGGPGDAPPQGTA
ncbi:MAG: AI-2E family transporter [Planctomycetota bacterium]